MPIKYRIIARITVPKNIGLSKTGKNGVENRGDKAKEVRVEETAEGTYLSS